MASTKWEAQPLCKKVSPIRKSGCRSVFSTLIRRDRRQAGQWPAGADRRPPALQRHVALQLQPAEVCSCQAAAASAQLEHRWPILTRSRTILGFGFVWKRASHILNHHRAPSQPLGMRPLTCASHPPTWVLFPLISKLPNFFYCHAFKKGLLQRECSARLVLLKRVSVVNDWAAEVHNSDL